MHQQETTKHFHVFPSLLINLNYGENQRVRKTLQTEPENRTPYDKGCLCFVSCTSSREPCILLIDIVK